MTQQKIVPQKIIMRKQWVLILIDGSSMHVIAMGSGESGGLFNWYSTWGTTTYYLRQ